MRWQPALRTLPPYYDDPLYIGALKASLERQLAALDFEPERLLLSFHGMPQRTLAARRSLSLTSARRPRGCSAKQLGRAGRRRLPVALRPGEMAGAGDRRDARRLSGAGREASSPSPRPAFPPTASKRWRSSASAAARPSSPPAATHFARLDCLNDSDEGMAMLDALIRPRTCRMVAAVLSAADNRNQERESWREWRS